MKELIFKPCKINGYPCVTIFPKDFDVLEFDEGNRVPSLKHIKKLQHSFSKNGLNTTPVLAKIKGCKKLTIVEGQHTILSFLKEMNHPIDCILRDFDSKKEMYEVMKEVNNSKKSWVLPNYINMYTKQGLKDYILLEETAKKHSQITLPIQAYTLESRSVATKMVKNGTFRINNKEYGDKLLQQITECKSISLDTRPMGEALIKLMLNVKYNHKKMIRNLKSVRKNVQFSTKEGELYNQLLAIYNQ